MVYQTKDVKIVLKESKKSSMSEEKWDIFSFFLPSSSTFDLMAGAENSPIQNTRLFGLENTPSHFVSSDT